VRLGLDALLTTLGKCFKKDYLPDLFVRHELAIKSQTATPDQKTFRNQINTLRLNLRARHYDREPPKTDIRLRGKRVLVVDDICTNGRSLDAARAYIEATGGTAVLFSWLKTISRGFLHMRPTPSLAPFGVNRITAEPGSVEYR
jgi:predicted amidophosphoribosyltransferase